MSDEFTQQVSLGPSLVESAFSWFQRLIAVYSLMFGLLYWVRLVGVYPGTMWRFDLMPVHWQVAGVTLAALFPFAAIGLWMLASWGPVVWFICATVEAIMYVGMPQLFGDRWFIVVCHAAVALLYVAFRLVIYREHQQQRR